jgi:hypothetical protein
MLSDEEFVKIVSVTKTMALASKQVGMSFRNFKKRAEKLNCYKPNQGGKGTNKSKLSKISTKDILEGKYPEYQTYKLKIRLIEEGLIEDKCSICGWKEKRKESKFTSCELDHINGNPTDHSFDNLRLVCPNCHSLTETYRFRRGKTNELRGKLLIKKNS